MARPPLYSDEELLEVARATFIELGPGVSTTVIAERAGVSQATLFKRFGSKDELLVRALLPPERPPFLGRIEGGPDERPFADQAKELLLEMDIFFRGMVPAMMMLKALGRDHFKELSRYEVPPPVRCYRALVAWLERAASAGLIRPLNNEALAITLVGSMQSRRFLGHISNHKELEGGVEAFIDDLVENLQVGFAPEERA